MSKVLAALVVISLASQTPTYRVAVEAFRKDRASAISGETGWAALTDLQWLATGQWTVGRGRDNRIVLNAPSSPERLGTLSVSGKTVTLDVARGVSAMVNGHAVTNVSLKPDAPMTEAVRVSGLTLGVIERGGKLALRVWDRMSPGRVNFHGLRWFPVHESWSIKANFVAYEPGRTLRIQNIVGQIVEMANPGFVLFTAGGKTVYRLEALIEEPGDRELFFMFRDATSNKTTYGAGRYLYTPMPADGRVVIDFNRAMNPPCAFTKFATCPLPPKGNTLTIAVEAGEKNYE
jgi:uncharacterized protein (DUF1684 family)